MIILKIDHLFISLIIKPLSYIQVITSSILSDVIQYNIQDYMEYPFDDEGLDDINLQNFKINR
ncbi:MAG: hypothetical protein ACI83H_001618 [Glaciecola sp.]